MKMMTTAGFSAHGGQTLSPYVGQIVEGEKILGHSVSEKKGHLLSKRYINA